MISVHTQQRDTSLVWPVDCGPVGATLMACPGAILQGMKEGGEKPRGARMADKAGWIKKSSGGFLGLWKDRYLLLCQAQLLVYENEVRTCLALRLGVWGRGQSEGSLSPQEDPRTGAGRRVHLCHAVQPWASV